MFDYGNMITMKRLRNDIILLLVILLLAGALFLYQRLGGNGQSSCAEIRQDGTLIGTYELTEAQTIPVRCEGGYNLIQIAEGQVSVTDADCPDQLCRKQRSISRDGESIICLPHKLVICIRSVQESTTDAVTY